MVWPPPNRPTNKTNETFQVDDHAAEHNALNAAMNDTTQEITDNNEVFRRGSTSESASIRPLGTQTLEVWSGAPITLKRHSGQLLGRTGEVPSWAAGHVEPNWDETIALPLGDPDPLVNPGPWTQIGGVVPGTGHNGARYLCSGMVHCIANQGTASAPEHWTSSYNYSTPDTLAGPPGSGNLAHPLDDQGNMAINMIDQDGNDRTDAILRLKASDKIWAGDGGTPWTVTGVPANGTTWASIPVSPADVKGDEGIKEFRFQTFPDDIRIEFGMSRRSQATAPDYGGVPGSNSAPLGRYQTREYPWSETTCGYVFSVILTDSTAFTEVEFKMWARAAIAPVGALPAIGLGLTSFHVEEFGRR